MVVGAGDMGRNHIRCYQGIEDVILSAVVDSNENRAKKASEDFKIPNAYTDYNTAFEKEKPDIISVCLPAFLHSEVSVKALKQGINVLCEKPIALNVQMAQDMVNAAKSSKAKLAIIFQERYCDFFEEFKKRMSLLGKGLIYRATDMREIRPKILMHSKSGNGGPIIDCCVHDIDRLLQLFGRPKMVFAIGDVYAKGKKELKNIHDLAIDTASINMEFENGNKAEIFFCWGLPKGFSGFSNMEILGPEGVIKNYRDRIEHYFKDGKIETVSGLFTDGHKRQIKEFVSAIQNGEQPQVEPQQSLKVLKVAEAILKSIETCKIVDLNIYA